MTSPLLRKVGFVAAGGVAYMGGLLAYTAVRKSQTDIEETERRLATDPSYSFVTDPHRSCTFNCVADRYDEQIDRDEIAMGINWLRRSLLYFHAKGTVLEVGAGTGRNLNYYPAKSVDRVLLMDSSDRMLSKAQQKISSKLNDSGVVPKPHFACIVGDTSSLDKLPNDAFDTVVDTFGLCSYNDPVKVLNEMARVCKKKNGKILLLEHGRSKTWDFISQYLDENAERHAKNWGCVWNRDLDDILERSGLELDIRRTWHFGTTYYIVCRPKPS
jgi:methyltransferase OMS1, mitochondrial